MKIFYFTFFCILSKRFYLIPTRFIPLPAFLILYVGFFLQQQSVREDGIEPFLMGMASHIAEREDNVIATDLQSTLDILHLLVPFSK